MLEQSRSLPLLVTETNTSRFPEEPHFSRAASQVKVTRQCNKMTRQSHGVIGKLHGVVREFNETSWPFI